MTRRWRMSCRLGMLAGVLLVQLPGAVASADQSVLASSQMSQRYGPFLATQGGGYTVTMDYARRPPASAEGPSGSDIVTLAKVAVLDPAGQALYERTFTFQTTPNGFEPEQIGTAYEVRGESGAAIVIEAYYIHEGKCPANASGWMIALLKHGATLRLAGPEIRFHGQIEHFPGPPLGPRQLVGIGKGIMRTREWTGHYSFIRSYRADFSAPSILPTCTKDCTFPVVAQAQPLSRGRTCRLHTTPLGSVEEILVQADSRVEYLDAYVGDPAGYDRTSDDGVRRPWLHVRLNGREGWVTDPADLAAIGLPYTP